MDVVVHDFSGHPFQADLARRLAERGHRVVHISCPEYVSGKGQLQKQPGDPDTLTFDQISLGRPFDKYSPRDRIRWELEYGRAATERVRDWPGVVIMCNVPLVATAVFVRKARRLDIPWVFWHQDVYSAGIADELSRRLPAPAARPAAFAFDRLEAWCARHAGHVVAIGEAFTKVYPRWNVDPKRVSVIPNWAPLDEVVPTDRNNSQASTIFPGSEDDDLRLLYAGTLGRKHNPKLLVDLLESARAAGIPAVLSVVSQGEAADDLRQIAAERPDLPLTVLPFQPAEMFSETLGSADVLIGLLEPAATEFSIPSKVLTYMCAGRPLIGLMPATNPAAADIADCGGFVADPTPDGVAQASAWLTKIAGDSGRRAEIGRATRSIAEERFDPDVITGRFESVLASLSPEQTR